MVRDLGRARLYGWKNLGRMLGRSGANKLIRAKRAMGVLGKPASRPEKAEMCPLLQKHARLDWLRVGRLVQVLGSCETPKPSGNSEKELIPPS